MRLLSVFKTRQPLRPLPVWFMRQAGRYLPEYNVVRSQFDDFISFCLNPAAVEEVTLQPLRRFPLDAAIIFSDILVIPHFLGQKVTFQKDHGPVLQEVNFEQLIEQANLDTFYELCKPITQAIHNTRKTLCPSKALLGFAGAPFTLLTYMIRQSKDQSFEAVIEFEKKNPLLFTKLLKLLETYVAELLILHIKAGANAVQLFESWAIMAPLQKRQEWLYQPLNNIVQKVRSFFPEIPFIYYGKGVNEDYASLNLDIAFGIDETADLKQIRSSLPPHIITQGNLSPQKLCKGDFEKDIDMILQETDGYPHIFNLGHGIIKETQIHQVEKMLRKILK